MDWTKQSEEMFKSWSETQQKMWNSWLEALQQSASSAQAADVWQKTINTWQETVNNTLAAQAKWTDSWSESFEAQNGTPEEMAQWVEQTQKMAKQWNEAQQKLWQNWFDLMKRDDLTGIVNSWQEEGQKAFTSWQESVQKVMDAQMQWLKMWAPDPDQKK